jgi:hypothetical protein
MSYNSEKVKKWRKTIKQKLTTAMGGKCQCCGYEKCNEALEFHHLDPSKKDFSFGKIRANPVSWDKIVKEVKKCILVCSNCHKEIHYNSKNLPENYYKFNDDFLEYTKVINNEDMTPCSVCGKLKTLSSTVCSRSCAAKLTNSIDWEKHNIKDKYEKGKTPGQISSEIGVCLGSVIKRLKKEGIVLKKKCPSKDKLEQLIKEKPFTQIGKEYGVSDNAVRKWCKKYNINSKIYGRGYWAKIQSTISS